MHRVLCLAVAVLVLSCSTVLAQLPTGIKTPPLQNSDTFILLLDIHNSGPNPPYAGWAGGRMKVHILDATEMDVDAITPVAGGAAGTAPPILDPFGPRSENVQSVPATFTAWHPLAQQSGIDITPSANQPLFDMTVHVKGSNPSNNSDIDATLMFWNIWHLRDNPTGSTFVQLEPSDFIWVTSNIDDVLQLHTAASQFLFPTDPATVNNPNAHWLHITDTVTFHLPGGPGSQFFATLFSTATLGIEHVPEPASAVLLAAGMASGVAGLWFRRRRRKTSA